MERATRSQVQSTRFVQVFESEFNTYDVLHHVALDALIRYVRIEEEQRTVLQAIADRAASLLDGSNFQRSGDEFGSETRRLAKLLAQTRRLAKLLAQKDSLNDSLIHYRYLMSEGE